jgi:hypothetical protein
MNTVCRFSLGARLADDIVERQGIARIRKLKSIVAMHFVGEKPRGKRSYSD